MTEPCRSIVPLSLFLVLGLTACSDSLGPSDDSPGDSVGGPDGPDSALTYESATIGTLGGEIGWARGINARNEVVGVAENESGELRAFIWRDGDMEELEGLGGSFSGAYDINDEGLIVGEAETADGEVHAVLWRNGEPEDLGTLGGPFGQALAINEVGQVVGRSENSDGVTRPFLWSGGEMAELPLPPAEDVSFASAEGINDLGRVVGTWAGSLGHAVQEALLWTEGLPAGLPSPCQEAAASGINERGVIAGGGLSCPISIEIVPLVWEGGGESEYLEPLGGLQEPDAGQQNIGSAEGVNDKGQIVGWSDAAEGVWERDTRATLWNGEEPFDLSGAADEASPTAAAINDRSVAVGRAQGQPAIFVPDSEDGLLPALRSANRADAARGVAGGAGRPSMAGSMIHEAWAARLCASRPRVMSAPTAAEVLAGCD